MQLPKFMDRALSVYKPFPPDDNIPFRLYAYRNITQQQVYLNNPDTIRNLEETGYIPIPGDNNDEKGWYLASLISQFFEVINVQGEAQVHPWAKEKDIEYVKKYPVSLILRLNDDPPAPAILQTDLPINMLQFLPSPQHGHYAVVQSLSERNHYEHRLYHYLQLGDKGKQHRRKMNDIILDLAGGTRWTLFDPEVHPKCSSVFSYLHERQNIQANILNPNLSVRQIAQRQLIDLEQAFNDVVTLRESWLRPDWLDKWQEIGVMAQELAKDYYEHHENEEEKAKKNKPVPYVANVFHNGYADIYNALPFHAFPAATISRKPQERGGQWSSGEWVQEISQMENELLLSYQFPRSKETYVQIREEVKDGNREQVLANMWKQAATYSDLDSDVYLARLAQLMNGQKDAEGNTWITGQQILNYRGLKPKKKDSDPEDRYTGGHRWERLEEIAACMRRQANVRIKIDEMPIIDNPSQKRRTTRRRTITRESPLFMSGDIIYHNTLPLDGPSHSVAIAWQYRESSWMVPFLSGPNRYTTRLIETVLNYDPYHQQWEKRLSKYFMWWLRTNASNKNKYLPDIETLLTEQNLDIDHRFPQRTKDRFEKAMNQLAKDELLSWRYEEELELSSKRWLPTWLKQHIIVEDPPILKAVHSVIETKAQAIRTENNAQKQLTRQRNMKKKEEK